VCCVVKNYFLNLRLEKPFRKKPNFREIDKVFISRASIFCCMISALILKMMKKGQLQPFLSTVHHGYKNPTIIDK
jgi:hypothetical protein